VFLRFLTNDVPAQAVRVEKRFKEAEKGEIILRILPITVVEILFHLERWYGYSKDKAIEKVESLFRPEWMRVDDKNVIFEALNNYLEVNIDFVDVLTFSYVKSSDQQVLSFDKDYKKLTPNLLKLP
jgi:predicted nucleic-acid-binding protein